MDGNVHYYPLTNPQKGIWYTEKLYPGTSIGNVAGTLKIKGSIDYKLLEEAYDLFIKKNDSFRLRFTEINGEPYQYLVPYEYKPVNILDFTETGLEELYKWDSMQSQTPFELVDSQLYYCAIVKINENECGIYLNMHHLISDAWSIVLTGNKILGYYNRLKNNITVGTENEPSYIDYIISEREYIKSDKFIKDKEFWNAEMVDIPDQTCLKAHSAISASTRTRRKTFTIPIKLSSKIRAYCLENRVSVFALFISALSIYINRITSKDDFVFGVPVLNRTSAREKQTMGMFVSMIPLRIKLNAKWNFAEFSNNIASIWLSVLRHQKYPYDAVLKGVREGKKNIDKLYDIALSYQNAKFEKSADFEFQEGRWHSNGHQAESLFIHVNNRDDIENIVLDFDYLQDIFTVREIEFIYDQIIRILWHAIDNPSRVISKIEMISEKEKQKILYDFNNTKVDYPSDKTINMLFEEQAKKSPQCIAAIFGDKNITYGELNEKSNQLARTLRSFGLGPDIAAGIMLKRSIDIIISIFAVFKAGGAYLPIDPELPKDRIQYMLDDSKAAVLITETDLLGIYNFKGHIIDVKDLNSFNSDATELTHVNSSSDLAYIIYTSGSTGKPKAAMIQHRSVINYAFSVKDRLDYSSGNSVLCVTTMCFDIFVFEVFPTLIFGLKLVIANEMEQKIPELLADLIVRNKITKIMTTPSRMQLLAFGQKDRSCFSYIREIILGGEIFPEKLLVKLKELTDARIFNMYGPTETTVYSTFKELTNVKKINIGRPVSNTQIYILDENSNIVPIGVQGEICIGGHGLARGYYGRDDLTKEKFILNPFNRSETIYKTGDLGRWYAQGEIECLGRMDFQVKIRGYRVELGEIESQILEYPGIKDAVVVDRQDQNERKFLCAYFVTNSVDINISELKVFLGSKLPSYMVPSEFMKINEIPLSSNGKINRKELPEPEVKMENRVVQLPRNETEKNMISVWSRILDTSDIGIDDNLFELGADSLSVINFQTFSAKYDWNLTSQDFFKYQTIRELSEKVLNNGGNEESPSQYHTELFPRYDKFFNSKVKLNSRIKYNNILLTGVTGFLGMHVLDYILSSTDASVYCIIRQSNSEDIVERFKALVDYYFMGKRYHEMLGKRIFLIGGDISKAEFGIVHEEYGRLSAKIDCVVNTAANVKYYGNYTDSYNSNVLGVKECAEFCLAYSIPLNHISTLGVSGQYLVKQNRPDFIFTENDLFIGQNYMDNVYVRSKFEAENLINSYMNRGLTASVYRVGNLTGRSTDGVFQKNAGSNAFVNLVRSIVNIGLLPDALLKQQLEFTPVDLCSKAIVELMQYNECKNKVFHVFNHKTITAKKFIFYMKNNGYDICVSDISGFSKKIGDIMYDERRNYLSGVINDLNDKRELELKNVVRIDSEITRHYLKQIGFYWPDIDPDYLLKFFTILKAGKAVPV